MKNKLLIFILILQVFFSCKFIDKKTSLWTDDPVIAAYTEIYNAEKESNKIEVIFKENPAFSFYNEKKKADLIIGKYLNSPQIIKDFTTINRIFGKNNQYT